MQKKIIDLQPWLDYFKMLQQYEAKGFLEVHPKEHEAYITRAGLLTLSPAPAAPEGEGDAGANGEALHSTVTRLRAYAAYRSAHAVGQQYPADMSDPAAPLPAIPEADLTAYLSQPFAIHIVKEDYPHDLLLTLLLQQKRTWYGRRKEAIEVIDYTEHKPQEK